MNREREPEDWLLDALRQPPLGVFHEIAEEAATCGPPGIAPLMLISRDCPDPYGRLCAIVALKLIARESFKARVALTRIGKLPVQSPLDHVYLAAVGSRDDGDFYEPYDWLMKLLPRGTSLRRRQPDEAALDRLEEHLGPLPRPWRDGPGNGNSYYVGASYQAHRQGHGEQD